VECSAGYLDPLEEKVGSLDTWVQGRLSLGHCTLGSLGGRVWDSVHLGPQR
jgi:hypothetical protein